MSKCKSQSISNVCNVVPTIDQLKVVASKGFGGCPNITSDSILTDALKDDLQSHVFSNPKQFDSDGRIIYERFKKKILNTTLNYDELFDCLVDYIWLKASLGNGERYPVRLLSNPTEITGAVRTMLLKRYDSANMNYYKSNCIHEALQARKKFFSGLYPFRYEGSKEYLIRDETGYVYSFESLVQLESNTQKYSVSTMALFFGLTATAALADSYWRFG